MRCSYLNVRDAAGTVKETLKVSKLCFGSLCIGPLQSDLAVADGAEIIRCALRLGVNFIDTAQLYETYPYIARAAFPDTVISTKTYAYTKKLAEDALNEALRELGRDAIDIFMLHEQESVHTIYGHIEALEYLFEQKRAGKIKAVGISTHHVAGVAGALEFNRTYKGGDKLDVIHPMLNVDGLGIIPERAGEHKTRQMEQALADAKENGFFIFTMKPLGGGNLFASADRALRYCLDKPYVDSVAVGMKSELEVAANAHFFETGRFTDEYYRSYIEREGKKKRLHIDGWCEGCGKCAEACPAGALGISGGRAVCDGGKCVLCGYCARACGCFAVKII